MTFGLKLWYNSQGWQRIGLLAAPTKVVQVHWAIHLNVTPEDIPTVFLRGCGWSADPKMQGVVAL